MTRRVFIASPSNSRLKALRRLARERAAGVVLSEGSRSLRSALAAGARVREVYTAPGLHLGASDAPLVARAERRGARVLEVDPAAFRTISRHVRPDGILALVERPSTALSRLQVPSDPLVVVAVAIERPGNLGTIVRTCRAVGAAALLVSDPCTDLFQRDVVRGSVGAIFGLPLAADTSEQTIAWLRRRRFRIVAATPGGTVPYWNAAYEGAVALVFGGERSGLPDAWLEAADEPVRIPMQDPVDSLNVGVAAGVVLFEAARQRVGRYALR